MSLSLEEIADLLALRALVDAYASSVDARDADRFAGLFTADGSLAVYESEDAEPVVEYRGHEALRSVHDLLRNFTTTFHLMANHTCEVAGDEATGEVYCMAHHIIEDAGAETDLVMYIRYRDAYVRTGDGWRFTRRDVMRQWTEERPAQRRPLDLVSPVKVGIYTDMRNPPEWRRPWAEHYSRTMDRIVGAERMGIDSVWVTEHHFFEDGYLSQPLTLAAAIAGRTRRMRIGTAVMLAPLRPPIQIAEEAALVDLVSGGRLELGLGAGYRVPEFTAYGVDPADRFKLLRRSVREVRRLWAEGVCTPPPVQDPVPIWLGLMTPRGARIAGRLGTGLLWLDERMLEAYREGLAEGGHDPGSGRMSGLAMVILADDPEEARARIRPHLVYQRESYARYGREGLGDDEAALPPTLVREAEGQREHREGPGAHARPPRLHVLTPDEAIPFLRGWLEGMPVEHVFFWESIAGMPDDLADRHVELLATRLRPALAGSAQSE